jgi:calcineurin-like phosphoesterase family protein
MYKVFVAADHHFGHKKIVEFEPSRLEMARKLGYGDDWETMLIDLHNDTVEVTDIVVFLGDFSFNSAGQYLEKMNGYKILVIGNHDPIHPKMFEYFDFVCDGIVSLKGARFYKSPSTASALIIDDVILTHYSIWHDDEYDNQHRGAETIKHQKAILKEIAEDWGCVDNVHGHLHSKQTGRDDSYNVSVECTRFRPVLLEEVLKCSLS